MVKTYYVYEVRIEHPKFGALFYIGMHSWEGDGIDPDYWGSCKYRHYKTWIERYPKSIRILWEGSKEEVTAKESECIYEALIKYGSFLRGLPGRSHLKQFKTGVCLNGSCSKAFNLNRETHAKGVETRRPYQKEIFKKSEVKRDRSESNRKAWKTIKERGEAEERFEKLHSPQAREKAVQTCKERGGYKRTDDQKRKSKETRQKNARKCILSDGFVGTAGQIVEHTGFKKGSVGPTVSKAFRCGVAILNGVEFKPV